MWKFFHTAIKVPLLIYLLVNLTFLLGLGTPLGLLEAQEKVIKSHLYKDVGFYEKLLVNNKTVMCDSHSTIGSSYLSPMYTCAGISVDGVKLYHGYVDQHRGSLCTDCPCGVNRGEPNDIHALCKAMLRAQNIKEDLTAAYIIKPYCVPLEPAQEKIKYFLDDGMPVWKTVMSQNGHITTLQCMTK